MEQLQRIEYLKKLVKAQEKKDDKHTYSIRWRDKDIHLVVIRVDTSFPKFRLESGRTRRKQIEYLDNNPHAPKDLFEDPESDEAQEAQGQILLRMVDDEGLRKDLIKEGQRQPSILTYDGYVLNGNRRLAALRDQGEQYMDCAVLPEDATPKDLYELELDLQMSKETKAEYNWVDELLHIRYGLETLEEKESVVSKKMRTSIQQVRHKINMLHLVDIYLDWLKKLKMYHIVEGDEQVFIELEKYIRKVKDPKKQKIIREQVFSILTYPPSEGRLYKHVTDLFKQFDEVQKNIVSSMPEQDQERPPDKKTIEVEKGESIEDPLSELASLEKRSKTATTEPLFENPELAEEHVTTLVNAIQDAMEKGRERRDQYAAYNAIRDAQRKLQGVMIDSNTLELKSISSKLQEIIVLANELIANIKKLTKKQS